MNGAYIFGCAGPRLTSEEAAFFREANPWGFILFDRNLENAGQIQALCADLRHSVGRAATVFIDQEGGRVQRLRAPIARNWRPALDFTQAAGIHAPRAMYLRYRLIAAELTRLGIDGNCAPLADIATDKTHPVLRNRCYGVTPGAVISCARGVSTGLIAGGVLPVLKHIPGHGRAQVDSHIGLPSVDAAPEVLMKNDFEPFASLADLPIGMTAHVVFEAYDGDAPATTSKTMIDIIRSKLGFSGLLMTDDISMEALKGSPQARSAAALKAGCDLALHCNGDLDEMRGIADALGPMSKAAAIRAEEALKLRDAATEIDIPATEAELEALITGGPYDPN